MQKKRGLFKKNVVSALNTWFASVLGSKTFHADVPCPALTLHLTGNLPVLSDG